VQPADANESNSLFGCLRFLACSSCLHAHRSRRCGFALPCSNRNKTLKPQKAQKDGKQKQLSQFAQHTLATLGSGSMLQAVKLPKGEDQNEWLAGQAGGTMTKLVERGIRKSAQLVSVELTVAHFLCFAVNTVDFFNELSMLYGTISEYCTKASCPQMVRRQITKTSASG
jgi:MOB kinase activator 1